MRILPLIAALALLGAGPASAQTASPPSEAAPTPGAGLGNRAVNPVGNAPSSVNASGTVSAIPMAALAAGANSFTEGQARSRIEGAGFDKVAGLAKDGAGIWRGHGERDGRTFSVGFDYKGQLAFE